MSSFNCFFKYPGGKWRIAEWIISHFPSHNVYLEPFFGSGGVFFNKEPSYLETINDINGDIVNLFKVCREHPAELSRLLSFTPWAREEYINCYKIEGDEVERARRFLVRQYQSFGSANCNLNSWRNSHQYNSPRCAMQWNELPEMILKICGRLKMAQIENKSAFDLIANYNNSETLIYLDPPYLQSIRKRNLYKYEMSDKQHEELLELIKCSKSKICLSAYDNDLYNERLKGWYTDEKKTTVQMGIQRVEKLYMNYQPSILYFF